MSSHPLEPLLNDVRQKKLLSAMLCSPQNADESRKVGIRPIVVKGVFAYQVSDYLKDRALHRNVMPEECCVLIQKLLPQKFRQATFTTQTASYHILVNRKQEMKIITKAAAKKPLSVSIEHNRTKNYILAPGSPIPFLVELGIMRADGSVVPKKYDKFRQINRFVEIIDDLFECLLASSQYPEKRPLEIVDFGCGKSYLTFALHYYLHQIKKLPAKILGIDLKQDLIQQCAHLADKLGCEGLQFAAGDIHKMPSDRHLDVVICLHACDTATDAALVKAVRSHAKAILAVPCCQHELSSQLSNPSLAAILRHGILKERLAALVTDAARAELLGMVGYDVQVVEFIDLEHTPKNLLIRAIKADSDKQAAAAQLRYSALKRAMQIDPYLERCLRSSQNLQGDLD